MIRPMDLAAVAAVVAILATTGVANKPIDAVSTRMAPVTAPADVSVPPLVIESVPTPEPTPEPTPPIVRGVVTCLTAAPDRIAAVDATMGPMSPAEINKGVGC